MKTKLMRRSLALVLALVMLLPLISIPSFASQTTAITAEMDFENFETGAQITADDGFNCAGGTWLMPFNKVLEDETGNRFWRIPIVATDVAGSTALKTQPTNRAGTLIIPHAAFSTTEATSISLDVDLNGVGGTSPNAGIWIAKMGYTDASGAAKTASYCHLAEVNLNTGELTFNGVEGYTKTGAKGLVEGQWNTLEIVFYPANGLFDIYVNDVLYAMNCKVKGTEGTSFTVAANQVMFAVDSGNPLDGYVTPEAAGNDFENANYLDADNVTIKTVTGKTGGALLKSEDYESYTVGNAVTLNGLPYSMSVSDGDSGRAVRVPLVASGSTTNKGKLGAIGNPAIPTGKIVSIKVDMRPHAAADDVNPLAGIWLHKVTYTPADTTTAKTQSYTRGLEFNLATGAMNLTNTSTGSARGTLTGAPGLIADEWNSVELILDTRDGSYTVLVNGRVYLVDGYFNDMQGSDYSIQANTISYALCSSNSVANFTDISVAGSSYENASYLDADNFTVTYDVADVPAGETVWGFEEYTVGTVPAAGGYVQENATGYSMVVNGTDGDRALRLPIVCSTLTNHKTQPTNSGGIFKFKNAASPKTGATSIKAELYLNYEKGSKPSVGFWTTALYYTDTTGAAKSQSWFHFADVNLKTGELTFEGHSIVAKVDGAVGMTVGAWNTIEMILDHDTGRVFVYINERLYSVSAYSLVGTEFYFNANTVFFCATSGNPADGYIEAASASAQYENANYADLDELVISDASARALPEIEGERWSYGFEDLEDGATTLLTGLASEATVVTENGDKVIKIPYSGKKRDTDGAINIDKNAYVSNPAVYYTSTPRLVIEENFFIPAEHTGGFDIRFGGANAAVFYPEDGSDAINNRSVSWLTLCRINYTTAGATATLTAGSNVVGTAVNNVIKKGEWVNVAADIDMVNGTYDLYVNGAIALADIAFRGQYSDGSWHYGAIKGISFSAGKFIFVSPFNSNNASTGNYVLVDDVSWHTYSMKNEIEGATVSLGEDLSVNYYVNAGKSAQLNGDLSMRFTMNGQSVTVTDYAVVGDKYVFTLAGIAPQQMGDSIDAVLYAGDVVITEKSGYSIKENLTNLLAKTPAELSMTVEKYTAMKTLISDLLSYGAAAQAYRSSEGTPVTNGVALAASARIPAASDDMKLSGNADDWFYFKSATVRFDTVNSIRIKLFVNDELKESAIIRVNGEELSVGDLTALGDGNYLLEIKGLSALNLDQVYTVELIDGIDTLAVLSYSANAYVSAMLGGATENETMQTLALALYRYGMSAQKYAATK